MPQNRLRYHGRIDDQFAKRGVRNANPSGNDLKDAIDALLKGEEVQGSRMSRSWVARCPEAKTSDGHSHLLQGGRQDSPGELPGVSSQRAGGPVSARDLRPGAGSVPRISRRWSRTALMPPWKAASDVGGPFKHDRSLSRQGHRDPLRLGRGGRSGGRPGRPPCPAQIP